MRKLFLALTGARGLAAIVLLGCNVLFARWAGPELFGSVTALVSAATFMFVAFDFGMSTYIIRLAARQDYATLNAALRLNYYTSVLGAAITGLAFLVLSRIMGFPMVLACLGVALAFEKSSDALVGVFIARGNTGVITEVTLVRRFCMILVFPILHYLGVGVVVAYTVGMLLSSAVGWLQVRIALAKAGLPSTPRIGIFALLKAGLPFFWASITASARNLDTLLVSVAGGSHMAGLWSAAQKLTTPFMLIPGALSSAILPHASRAEKAQVRSIAMRLAVLHLGIAFILALISVFSAQIVKVVFGSAFLGSSSALGWTLVAFPFIALSSALGGILQGHDQERFVAKNGVVFALLYIAGITVSASFDSLALVAVVGMLVYVLKCATLLGRVRQTTR